MKRLTLSALALVLALTFPPLAEALAEAVAVPPEEEEERSSRSEADLRGSLSSDLSEDERRLIEEDRERAQAAADLRDEDYQLAYAIDILKGLAALGPEYAAALARQAN